MEIPIYQSQSAVMFFHREFPTDSVGQTGEESGSMDLLGQKSLDEKAIVSGEKRCHQGERRNQGVQLGRGGEDGVRLTHDT